MVDPVLAREALIIADIDHGRVREERQTLDQSGHYARPDVLQLQVDRRRQSPAEFKD